MIEKISNPPRPNTCPNCRMAVIWARMATTRGGGFKTIAVERCADGAGSIAFFPELFPATSAPLAEIVCNGTSWRAHREHCPVQSFTAQARRRKE